MAAIGAAGFAAVAAPTGAPRDVVPPAPIGALLFSVAVLDGFDKLGYHIPLAQKEDLVHLWRYVAHVIGVEQELIPGSYAEARRLAQMIFATQGAILVKAGLELQGRGVGGVRLPLVPATDEQRADLARALEASGLASGPAPTAP